MSDRWMGIIVAGYMLLGCVSWGHFISRGCMTTISGTCSNDSGLRVIGGFFVAMFWPVYVSSVAFEEPKL